MELDDEEDEQRLRDDGEEDEGEEAYWPQGGQEGGVSYVQPTWGGPRSTSHLSSRGSLHSTRRGWATSSSSSTAPPSFTSSAAVTYYASPPASTTSSSFTSRRSTGLGASTSVSAPRHQPQPQPQPPPQTRPSGSDLALRCAYSYATDDESPLVPQQTADDEGDVWVVGDVRDAYYGNPYGNTPSPTAAAAAAAASGGGDEWRRDPYAYCLDGDEPGRQMGYTSGGRGDASVGARKGRSAPGMASMATSTMAYGGGGHAAEGGATKKPERRKLSLSATLNQKTSYDGECERDWNALLQSILELHEDTLERRAKKVKELQRLCLDFSEVVCRFGELIIREIVLDDDEKTLKPVRPSDGTFGVAGGDKYIVAGCFFKFLTDRHGIYDGDEFAMKSGNAELRGLKAMSALGIPELCFPLVAIVDFRGYRLLASSRLPLGTDTLKYGSADAGRQFHSSVGRINSLMKRVGHSLNLKAHKHPIDAAEIYGPCDIEVHVGRDRRVYVVDAARLMPPSAGFDRGKVVLVPADAASALEVLEFHLDKKTNLYVAVAQWFEQRFRRNSSSTVTLIYRRLEEYDAVIVFQKMATEANERATHFAQHSIRGDAIIVKGARGQWLYNFLRPEAVKSGKLPLNSDSLSGFPTHDHTDNQEVEDATYYLLKVTIPRLAAKLDDRELVFVNSKQLIQMVHEHGVNLRFLAYLRSLVHNTYIKRFLLSEMISRAIKAALRGKMRTITAHKKKERKKRQQAQYHPDEREGDEDEAYKEVAVQYFNLILGMGNESNECWRTDVKILLLLKYSLIPYNGRGAAATAAAAQPSDCGSTSTADPTTAAASATGIEGDQDAKQSSLLDIEHLSNYHFREQIGSKLMLFQMLQKYTGIKFDHETQQLFIADPTQFEQECPFSLYDVQITPCIKTIQYAGKLPDLLHQSFSPAVNSRTQHVHTLPQPTSHNRSAETEELFEMEMEKSTTQQPACGGRPKEKHEPVPAVPATGPSFGAGYDLQRYEENLQLVNDICGHNSIEAVLSIFQVADLHSRQGLHLKALKLIHTACKTLHDLGECPAEIVIGFYYLLGFVYERMSDYRRAIRAFETSLDFLERVYGDAREPCGRGLGHPFGLLLCSKLVDLTEHELQFAAAFRFSKKFEDFWKIFPFPMKGVANAHLTERIFFSNDPPLALFGSHKKRNLPEDAPTRAWLKRVNVFDNLGDVMVSTLMLGGEDGFFDESTKAEDDDSNDSTEEDEQTSNNGENSNGAPKPSLRQSSRNVPALPAKTAAVSPTLAGGAHGTGGSLWLWGQGRNASLEGSGYNLERPCVLSGIPSPVVDVACSSTHALFLVESGDVYTVADKLVESNSIPVTQPHRKGDGALTPHQVPQLHKKGRRIIKVGCASGFNVAVSRSGKVYGWGSSSLFPLRTKDNRTATPGIPHTIRALKGKRVVDVACGEHHVLFITGQGEVYSLGTGVLGALGQGTTVDQLVEPKQILALQKEHAVRAAAGENFSLVLTRDGVVYSFGAADKGQLGHPDPQDMPTGYPCPIDALAKIKITKIAAGHQHAMAISEYGEVYLWGANDAGQLGFETEDDEQLVPRHLPFGLPVVEAAGGKSHTVIIDQAGRVYAWGARAWSQLGHDSQMAVRQPRVVQGLMHARALKAVATYGMTLVLTEKVDEHDESSVVSAASPVPPLVLPASLSEPALFHARGRIGGRGGPLLKEPDAKKMKKRKHKKEQLIQRHILHHAAPNLSSLRFASKERQQASIALRDKLMKRPSRDELIRRRIIRPIAPSTTTMSTTITATSTTPAATAGTTSPKPGGQQQPQRVVTSMLTSSSSAAASTPGLRKSGTAVVDTRPAHAAAAAAANKKPQAPQVGKSSKQAQAQPQTHKQKQKQILLPIDNSSRHHEYHGEQLSDLDRQEKKKNNRHKWFHNYVPYVKKREDEDVNDVPYYSLASSSGLGASGGGGGGKRKTPRRRKKNRRRCESMVQLPPELLLAFAEDDYDDDPDRRRRIQRELYTLAAKESESAEVVDISSDANGGGGVGGLGVAGGVGGLLGTSPGLGFEPHSPTLDRWEEMQVALGDREIVTSTPRRRPRGQLVKKNKSEREISFHQRSATDVDVPPQPPMQQLHGNNNNLKQSHLLHPHHGGAAAQSGAGASAGGKGTGSLHVSSGRVKRHARSHSRDSKSSEALRHYQPQPKQQHGGRQVEYEPEESPEEEEEEESSYDDEAEEAESHVFGAWMGRRSGSHPRRKGKGSNILKQRSDDSWKWKASS